MTSEGRTLSWDNLPKQPWPEACEPLPGELADWLLSLTREQLVWLLGRQQKTWAQDSDCFVRNHQGEIEHLRRQVRLLEEST